VEPIHSVKHPRLDGYVCGKFQDFNGNGVFQDRRERKGDGTATRASNKDAH